MNMSERQQDRLQKLTVWFLGLGGLMYEAFVRYEARPGMLTLYAAMLGLPSIIGANRRSNGKDQ
jgi:hypothetical protein